MWFFVHINYFNNQLSKFSKNLAINQNLQDLCQLVQELEVFFLICWGIYNLILNKLWRKYHKIIWYSHYKRSSVCMNLRFWKRMQDYKDCFTNLLCKQSNAWCGILLTASCLWESPNLWRVQLSFLICFDEILKTVTNFIFARNCLWLSTIMLFCTIVLYMLSFGSWLITEKGL